jgi:hypothetical protein
VGSELAGFQMVGTEKQTHHQKEFKTCFALDQKNQ